MTSLFRIKCVKINTNIYSKEVSILLDQNTDRMWYVIGAVLIGAAIIFGMNTLMPEAFASVTQNFESLLNNIDVPTPEHEFQPLSLEEYRGKESEVEDLMNLLSDSKLSTPLFSTNYLVNETKLKEQPVVGELYTLVVKGSSNAMILRPHNSGPAPSLDKMVYIGDGYYIATFHWIRRSKELLYQDNEDAIWLYNGESYANNAKDYYNDGEGFTLEWMTMVEGEVPLLDWRP